MRLSNPPRQRSTFHTLRDSLLLQVLCEVWGIEPQSFPGILTFFPLPFGYSTSLRCGRIELPRCEVLTRYHSCVPPIAPCGESNPIVPTIHEHVIIRYHSDIAQLPETEPSIRFRVTFQIESTANRCRADESLRYLRPTLGFKLNIKTNKPTWVVVPAGLEPAMLGNLHVLCVERYDSFYIDVPFS